MVATGPVSDNILTIIVGVRSNAFANANADALFERALAFYCLVVECAFALVFVF